MRERERANAAIVPAGPAAVAVAEGAALPVTTETVKKFICPIASDQELALFLNQCAMFQLNPFKREIYLVKYTAKDPATTIVGYEVYLKRADRTGKWAGMEDGVEFAADGLPAKAWVKVYRKDWGDRPLYHEVLFSEYVQLKDEWRDGQKTGRKVPTRFWSDKPVTMLKKVAIAQGFRMAFPDEMGGMPYIEEELMRGMEQPAEKAQAVLDQVEYQRSKEKPLPAVKDEFAEVAGDPGVDLVAEAEEAQPPAARPTMAQFEKYAKIKTDLAGMGTTEEILWKGIHSFTEKTLRKQIVELGDLTEGEMDMVLGYLSRWLHARRAEAEKAAEAGKVKK